MYAVMGITGQVGSAVADTLLNLGQKVRGIVRDENKAAAWKDRGVELFVADYTDPIALTQAFTGVEGVFAMIPPTIAPAPGFTEAKAVIATLRKAVSQAKPGRVAYLSSIGAEQAAGTGLIHSLHLLEEQLSSLTVPSAFLRASWFMENFQWDIPYASETGKIQSFLHPLDKPFSMVATEDIGRIVAETLVRPWKGVRFIEVTGPGNYSSHDVAEAMSSAIGRDVEADIVARGNWQSAFVAQGMPADRTAPRIEMLDGFVSGHIRFGAPGAEHIKGTADLYSTLEKLAQKSA